MIQTFDTILRKVLHFCSYQDRCQSEVKTKISSFDIPSSDKEKIMQLLIDEGFIDDNRFTRTFVRSKIHLKKWGVNKIKMALRQKGVSDDVIHDALAEIDSDIYRDELKRLLKSKRINESDEFKRKVKLAQYGIQKGYEPNLVWEVIKELEN